MKTIKREGEGDGQRAKTRISVGLHSINTCVRVCLYITPRAGERSLRNSSNRRPPHIFHHDSTALTTRASGLGWASAGLPHTQRVHRNLRTNPADPSSPLQKSTHTRTLIVSCVRVLTSSDVCFCPPQCGLFPCAEQGWTC